MSRRFEGKRALVLGVANRRSIAWAIARRLHEEGAELAFTYQGERIEKSVRKLAESVDGKLVTECDVRSDTDLDRLYTEVADVFGGGLDILVHSVAFAAAEDLEGGSWTRRATASGLRSTSAPIRSSRAPSGLSPSCSHGAAALL